ncbi:MAG: hypothetical protein Q8L92_11345, partial [Rubrivivax sp.]|nr:hypothetical protein [Rubrivivax sp.]
THLDEIAGAQPLPVGFTMRSLVVPASSGNVSVSATITPFSEMAVAAASRASGGVTATNAAQATSTVAQLLGFNPVAAPAPSTASTATADAQKLAIMLTAVAKMAADSSLGCATGSSGAKTQCVVTALAAAASTSSIALQNGSTNVSAVLGNAVTAVLLDPALSGAVAPSSLTTVVANLGCTGSACSAAPSTGGTPPGPSATVLAITSAKLFFTQLSTDLNTLFSRGGAKANSAGATNAEGWKFRQAMTGIQVLVDVMAKDLGLLLMAADLHGDYMSGRIPASEASRGRAPGEFDAAPGVNVDAFDAVSCGLYKDADNTVLATTPAEVLQIGCRALYFVAIANGVRREWRHGFSITANSDGSYSYVTRARLRTVPCNAPVCTNFNVALQKNTDGSDRAAYAGTLTPTRNASGNITAFSVTGKLPGAFTSGGTALANEFHEWNLAGTRTISGFKQEISALKGSLSAHGAGGSLLGTLTLKEGTSLTEIPVTAAGTRPTGADPARQGTLAGGSLNLVWATPGAEFEGLLSLSDGAWDSTGSSFVPTQVRLTGSARTIAGLVSTEFVSGSLSATLSGWSTFNSTAADSASNRYMVGLSFVCTASAPNRPKLEVTLGGSMTSDADDLNSMTMQYRSIVNGAPKLVIGAAGARGTDGQWTLALTEASADLKLSWKESDTSSDLFSGNTKIGTLVRSTGLITFTDGSFVSVPGL